MRRWSRSAVVAFAALALLASGSASARPLIGISDNHPDALADARLSALALPAARLVTPWDSVFTEPERLDAWLNAARAAGMEPFVSFEHGRSDRCPQSCTAPTPAEYGDAIDAFLARYPWVRTLSPWNEANHSSQPTATDPERAAAYYNAVVTRCPTCTIVAADVLADGAFTDWLARFRNAALGTPKLWGLHNYPDATYFRMDGTARMLEAVPGDVWLTETGGIVRFEDVHRSIVLPYDEERAAQSLEYLLGYLVPAYGARIPRVYVYEWRADADNRFDAGLVRPDGTARPSLNVVRTALGLDALALPDGEGAPGAGAAARGSEPGGSAELERVAAGLGLRIVPGRVSVASMRGVRVGLACAHESTACRARLRLVTSERVSSARFAGKAPRRVELAAARVVIPAGTGKTVSLVIPRRTRRMLGRLAHSRGLPADVLIVARDMRATILSRLPIGRL